MAKGDNLKHESSEQRKKNWQIRKQKYGPSGVKDLASLLARTHYMLQAWLWE
jgi:hypothetical protein